VCLVLGLLSAAKNSHGYLIAGILLLPLARFFRKDIDAEDFRPFRKMRPGERLFAVLWYSIVAISLLVLVMKDPKAIDYYDFRQFLLLVGVIFLPISPIALRREAELFRDAGKNET